MNKRLWIGAVSAIALAAFSAQAAEGESGWMQESERDEALELEPDLENGKMVYEVCSACHMPNGWGMDDGTFPQLAGQHRKVIIKQLADIRAKNRDNPTMYPFALPSEIGGPQSIADVAAYIEQLPMNPYPGVGPGENLELGAKLYAENCKKCHGEKGEGNNDEYYPKIMGQHYAYMVRQFQWIKEGKRRNANPEMVQQIQDIDEKEMNAILDWVSRQQGPKDIYPKECQDVLEQPHPRKEPQVPCWENPDFAW